MERRIVTNTPDADHVMTLLDSAKMTWTVLQACELQLFDALSPGPVSAGDLASKNKWQPDALRRLMDMMVAVKLVKKSKNSRGEEVYENTDAGRLLIKDGPPVMYEYASMVKDDIKGIGGLAETIKKGPQVEGTAAGGEYGDEYEGSYGPEFWLNIYRMSEGIAKPYADDVAKAVDLSKHKTVVDLGGGSGVFSYALLRAYPLMQVTIAELAKSLPTIEEHFINKNKDKRLTTKAVDYNKDELPKADLYIMANVIHDHEPEKAKELLTKIHGALNPGGGVLIIDQLMNDARDGPPMPHMWDLAFCGWGRMYSGKDLLQFLSDCNYGNFQVVKTQDTCNCDMVYATKI